MNLPRYNLSSDTHLTTFEFISEGPKGKIIKLVQYSPTNLKNVYNLAFGDKNRDTGHIDDQAILNNGDSEKILATVVSTIYAFTDQPLRRIFMQLEVQKAELGCIELELQDI